MATVGDTEELGLPLFTTDELDKVGVDELIEVKLDDIELSMLVVELLLELDEVLTVELPLRILLINKAAAPMEARITITDIIIRVRVRLTGGVGVIIKEFIGDFGDYKKSSHST